MRGLSLPGIKLEEAAVKIYSALWIVGFSLFVGNVYSTEEKILNVYTWSDYLPASVLKKFETETGIRINHSTYVNNEALYAKLEGNREAAYDIIMPSSYLVHRMKSHGLIQKINRAKVPNLKHINPLLLNKEHDPTNDYSLPYLWHSTGIVLNTKYHSPALVKRWVDLWDLRYKDQLFALDDVRDIFAIALLSLGYSANAQEADHLQKAYEYLKGFVKNVKLFNEDAQQSIYLDEDITLGMGWSGNIYKAQLENPHLSYIYPEEGFVLSLDVIAIPWGAKHVENAHQFINFISKPEIAKEISLATGFSSPNLGALDLLPKKIRNNTTLYPDPETMKRGVLLMDVGKVVSLYEKYYELLKLQ